MRLNRKGGPPKSMLPKLKKTDTDTVALTNGKLNLLRFFDKREVNVLTTAHDNKIVTTGKTNPVTSEAIVKLEAVHMYNKFMGAVDRSDQMVSYNAFKRRTLKWWKKAFSHMLMLGVLNAYILHKMKTGGSMTHRIFRREVAKQLASMAPMCPRLERLTPVAEVGESSLFRLTARHFLQSIPPKPGAKKQRPQRDCVVCTKPGNRKQSRYECPSCDVGLHLEPCFKLYHTQKDYKRALKRKLEEDQENSS
ncbi:PiggyBac transposable element-derived protein 4 [Plakobranchus ocellatus]|uniref:PiggyBac transposable element-derived protein 4 n=1 Tax=Plakobranchus ocellatus TaxID=259542 RepID=A0AAV3XVF8_9GAST|nr:PiggyBac transposable element-derived protein 4 [Plakobranchus ocellatus]